MIQYINLILIIIIGLTVILNSIKLYSNFSNTNSTEDKSKLLFKNTMGKIDRDNNDILINLINNNISEFKRYISDTYIKNPKQSFNLKMENLTQNFNDTAIAAKNIFDEANWQGLNIDSSLTYTNII